jgi:hypothetical protein
MITLAHFWLQLFFFCQWMLLKQFTLLTLAWRKRIADVVMERPWQTVITYLLTPAEGNVSPVMNSL